MTIGTAPLDMAVIDQAIDWHLALADADTARWHAFVTWLEADAAHRAAYDRVAIDDAMLAATPPEHSATPVIAQQAAVMRQSRMQRAARPRAHPHRAPWVAGIAALLVAGVALSPAMHGTAGGAYTVESPATAGRSLVLADGTRIELNRSSRVRLDRDNPRIATLERGEAMFHVHHDAASPFRVESGGHIIEDVGTSFNVIAEGRELRVAVAEGSVLFEPAADHIPLTAGMSLRAPARGDAVIGRKSPTAIGGWRSGRLEYADAPLSEVAQDLGRSTGVPIRVSGPVAVAHFSGVLRSDRGAAAAIQSLAALTGTRAQRSGDGWVLSAGTAGAT